MRTHGLIEPKKTLRQYIAFYKTFQMPTNMSVTITKTCCGSTTRTGRLHRSMAPLTPASEIRPWQAHSQRALCTAPLRQPSCQHQCLRHRSERHGECASVRQESGAFYDAEIRSTPSTRLLMKLVKGIGHTTTLILAFAESK